LLECVLVSSVSGYVDKVNPFRTESFEVLGFPDVSNFKVILRI
jgi:hypothetical protein